MTARPVTGVSRASYAPSTFRRPTLLGIAVGAFAAAVLTRFVAAMLYGVAPLDLA